MTCWVSLEFWCLHGFPFNPTVVRLYKVELTSESNKANRIGSKAVMKRGLWNREERG